MLVIAAGLVFCLLRPRFGHAKCEDARSSAAHAQCPTQFSCGTAAFWFRAATTHVQKAALSGI